jgi:hypothetical protein
VDHLKLSGHEAVFLSESVANPRGADLLHLDRISTCADVDDALFFEIEILPRLRAIRNRFFRGWGLVPDRKAFPGRRQAAREKNSARMLERTQQ